MMSETKWMPREQEQQIVQLIVFHLEDEEFGVPISEVREIIATGPVTPIPNSPKFIVGVINVRGEVPVVINLKERFSLRTKKEIESKHIVLTEQDKNLFGLLVDEVTEVLRVEENTITKAPELVTRIHEDYVKGVLTIDNRLILLLDLAKVLSEEDLERYAEIPRSTRFDSKEQLLKSENDDPPSPLLQKTKQAKPADKPVERKAPVKGKVKRK
jgi:purine-binding chemotaxis protein CheW